MVSSARWTIGWEMHRRGETAIAIAIAVVEGEGGCS